MKITKMTQINELVAEQLGYIKHTWQEECSQFTPGARWVNGGEYYEIDVSGWVTKELSERTDEEWEANCYNSDSLKPEDYYHSLEDYIVGEELHLPPAFSTNLGKAEQILDFLIKEDYAVEFWKSVQLAWICVYQKADTGAYRVRVAESYCGKKSAFSGDEDSSIVSLPLAICLAFLRLKGIEITLELGNEDN